MITAKFYKFVEEKTTEEMLTSGSPPLRTSYRLKNFPLYQMQKPFLDKKELEN